MSIFPNLPLVADALGWAVLHSLWQGALAAIAVWGFRALTRIVVGERAADTRYMFGFLTLVALFAAFIGTFLYYFNLGVATGVTTVIPTETINIELSNAVPLGAGNPLLQITSYTDTIGAIWALCFMVLGARYLAAFRLTHKLRTTGTAPFPSNWSSRFVELARQSGANDKVRGFLSEHVASPVTFGFFKPIILVPTWFFTGMSPEQCEAVLLHEFAHVRRHDYLTNVFQILIKTVFFYHPAVQYICTNINIDREHACDDLAVNLTRNPESLATALGMIRIKAARNAGVYAQVGILGADGPDAPIMHRLKRLMGVSTNVRPHGTARGFAATGMMVLATGIILMLGASQSIAHPISDVDLTNKANNTLNITGDGYKITGNKYYLKGKNGYGPGIRMKDGYSYAFEIKNGQTYAIRTDENGRSVVENIEGSAKNVARREIEKSSAKAYSKPMTETKKISKIVEESVEKAVADALADVKAKQTYQYDWIKIDDRKYKTKTNTLENITYINIDNNWHDIDAVDLDVMLPTQPVLLASTVAPVFQRTQPIAPVSPIVSISPFIPVTPLIRADKLQEIKQTGLNVERIGQQSRMRVAQWSEASNAQAEASRTRIQEINREWEQELAANQADFEKEWANQTAENQQEFAEETRVLEEGYKEEMHDLEEGYRDDQSDIEGTQNERAKAQRKLNLEFANDQRELAREFAADQRELAQNNAEWQREMAEEHREAEQDWAELRREARLEQTETRREAAQEARQLAQDTRQRTQDERQRARDEEQRIRDKKQRTRDKERRKENEKITRQYEKMRVELIPFLTADDYIKSANSKVSIKMAGNNIVINGKKLDEKNEEKYCEIISKYIDREDANIHVSFKPGHMHVSSDNKNGHSYTYTHNE